MNDMCQNLEIRTIANIMPGGRTPAGQVLAGSTFTIKHAKSLT